MRATTLYSAVSLNDPSWYGTGAAIWSMVEVNCAILCSCLPTIRYFLAIVFPCLGLRSEQSRYPAEVAGAGAGGSGGAFALRSRSRASGAPRMLGLRGSRRTAASRISEVAGKLSGGSSGSRDPPPPPPPGAVDDLLATRWGVDYEKGGPQYHSNHISAWVRTAGSGAVGGGPPEASSPTSSSHFRSGKRASVDEEGSERGLVEGARRKSDRELGNHILITRETLVEEGRADEAVIAFPARAL